MTELNKGKTLRQAAAKADMCVSTARRYRRSGKTPKAMRAPRRHRTRVNPFADVWPELEAMLVIDPDLQAATLWEHLQSRFPGRWRDSQHRTLRRHVSAWKKRHAARQRKLADIPQAPRAGEFAQSDWTHASQLQVTVGGQAYPHLLYHFSLTHSRWQWVRDTPSESFASLAEGLSTALSELGGVPLRHQTDNTTAASRSDGKGGRIYIDDYVRLTDHYGLDRRLIGPGKPEHNGTVESLNGAFKRKLDQRLRLRGSRDFADRQAYRDFLEALCRQLNGRRGQPLEADLAALHDLPAHPYPAYRERVATVTSFSTVMVGGKRYSVPSRHIGERLTVRIGADQLTLMNGDEVVAEHDLLHGSAERYSVRIADVIGSLLRKPGGFARCAYRESLLPNLTFRRTWDHLQERFDERRAAIEYLRILELSLTLPEAVRDELDRRLDGDLDVDFVDIRQRLAPRPQTTPKVHVDAPDLQAYDTLLTTGASS